MDLEPSEINEEDLLPLLVALASPVRLRLLKMLVVPARAPELKVPAGRDRTGFESERFLSRSTVIQHLDVLESAGLIRRVGEHYAVDQQGMVALLQDLNDLAKLRALIEVDVESTRPSRPPSSGVLPPAPRLVVASGPQAGLAFALAGEGPWEIGRAPASGVALAHDPHVSRVHVVIARVADGYEAKVADVAKNAAWIDFVRLDPGMRAELRGGSIVTVGATTLVLQL